VREREREREGVSLSALPTAPCPLPCSLPLTLTYRTIFVTDFTQLYFISGTKSNTYTAHEESIEVI
jgi:hypothetical protein